MTNEELAGRIKDGERGLLGQLWEQNKGLFHRFAWGAWTRYSTRCAHAGAEYTDLVQCAFLALCDAVDAYDPASGLTLAAYFNYPWRNHMSALLGLRTAKQDALNRSASLDSPLGDDETGTLADVIPDPESAKDFERTDERIYNEQLRRDLDRAISELPESRAEIIRNYYFDGVQIADLSQRKGITVSALNTFRRDALVKLRRARSLRAYRDEIIARAYRYSSYAMYKETGYSSVEYAVERLAELEQ